VEVRNMITTEGFIKTCGCRSAGECNHNLTAEIDALDACVNAFAKEMKRKLKRKYMEGFSGWDKKEYESIITQKLIEHSVKNRGEEIDIANLSMMLWNMRKL
jgi:hypothetical protein